MQLTQIGQVVEMLDSDVRPLPRSSLPAQRTKQSRPFFSASVQANERMDGATNDNLQGFLCPG